MEGKSTRFRKPGRPREDRVARRLEIFVAVAPALASKGHRLTMRQAARLAHVSVGTLYSYFDTKRALLLYGLDPEPAALLCSQFASDFEELRISDPEAFRGQLVTFLVGTLAVMRASVDCAIHYGPSIARSMIDRVISEPIPGFVALIQSSVPEHRRRRSAAIERRLRRTMVAALMEPDLDEEAFRDQLRVVLSDHA